MTIYILYIHLIAGTYTHTYYARYVHVWATVCAYVMCCLRLVFSDLRPRSFCSVISSASFSVWGGGVAGSADYAVLAQFNQTWFFDFQTNVINHRNLNELRYVHAAQSSLLLVSSYTYMPHSCPLSVRPCHQKQPALIVYFRGWGCEKMSGHSWKLNWKKRCLWLYAIVNHDTR